MKKDWCPCEERGRIGCGDSNDAAVTLTIYMSERKVSGETSSETYSCGCWAARNCLWKLCSLEDLVMVPK